jgi:hypothetical protein
VRMGDYFPGLKWPESEAGRPQPSTAEFKNSWSCTSFPIFFKTCIYPDVTDESHVSCQC